MLRPYSRLAVLACAATSALVMLPLPAAQAARFGTKVTLERGGVRSAAELSAFPDSRVFPRSQEPRAREEGPRNKEDPRDKHANPDSPRRAQGVVRSGGRGVLRRHAALA